MAGRFDFLQEHFYGRVQFDEPLARYTAARLGGPADAILVVQTLPEMLLAVRWAWKEQIPVCVLGGGANVLVADSGFRGLVLINRVGQIIINNDESVTAESGANFATVARRCMKRGLAGLEWAVSVPGTIGGAAINNAGAHGGDMTGCVKLVTVHRPGGVARYSCAEMTYAYRSSILKNSVTPFLVTLVTLQLTPGNPAALVAQAAENMAHRKATQPPGASLGSIFKNPPGDYAGRLIEAAGLKGTQRGSVRISPIHANFFVNLDGAGTAADYYALLRLAQQKVAAQFDVLLEPEISFVGDFPA